MLLAIETSCDETGVALFDEEGRLIKELVFSQVDLHSQFGGIVPEIASRKHLEILPLLTKSLLKSAGAEIGDIKAIGVTFGPGLIGSLLVGVSFAKALAFALKIPVIKVDHLIAHLFVIFLEKKVEFPFIGLLVSGGHTALFLINSWEEIFLIGHTRDDAGGEAFDKVAKLLGLGYPGGPVISELAKKGDPEKVKFPRPLLNENTFDFSFSGLKTAVVNYLKKNPDYKKEDVCAGFEEAVCEVLVKKTLFACEKLKIPRVVVAGGVASNERLRKKLFEEGRKKGIKVYMPDKKFCTDNGVMVGVVAFYKWKKREFCPLTEEPYARAVFKKLSTFC